MDVSESRKLQLSLPVATFPCIHQGCIVYAGTPQVPGGTGYFTEAPLNLSSTQGVPLLAGSTAPTWGSVNLSSITALSGGGTTLVTTTGALTNGDCVAIASSTSDFVDSTVNCANVVTASSTLTNNAPVLGNAFRGLTSATHLGNTTTYSSVSGTPGSTTNLVAFDGSGNITNAGVAGTKPFQITGANYTNNSATVSTVVTSETIPASVNASFSCFFTWLGSLTSTALTIQINTPATPTAINANVVIENSNTAPKPQLITAGGTSVTGGAAVIASQAYTLSIYGTLENGSNSGTIQIQAAESGGGTVTINRGGFCKTFY